MLKGDSMKNYSMFTIRLLIIALVLTGLTRISEATTYTFQSYDGSGTTSDMYDLDHNYYYSWQIKNWNLKTGEVITGAKLEIFNIWDWTVESNDILRIYLLDKPPTLDNPVTHNFSGYSSVLSSRYDGQKNDYWNGKGPLVGTWTDPKGGNNGNDKVADLTFNLPVSDPTLADLTDLTNFIKNDGIWGFGLDPDCHYFNDGIKFTITTQSLPVPEPSTLLLIGSGLVGLGLISRRFKR